MDLICLLTSIFKGEILFVYYLMTTMSLFSMSSPCDVVENSNKIETIEVIRGNDVNITFTMPKRPESTQIFIFTKETKEKLGMCLKNGKCYHLDGDYERNEFKVDGNSFLMLISDSGYSDAGNYTYEIYAKTDNRVQTFTENCSSVVQVSLVVHDNYSPTCNSFYLHRRNKVRFSCDWTWHTSDISARFLYGNGDGCISEVDTSDNSQNTNMIITVPITFDDVFTQCKAPEKCLVSRKDGTESHCNFTVFLDPKEERIEVNGTKVLLFKCCAKEDKVPDVYIVEYQTIINNMISGVAQFDYSTDYEQDFRDLKFVILCGIEDMSKIVTYGIANLSLHIPLRLKFSISANITGGDLDSHVESFQLSCKRPYDITIVVQPTDRREPNKQNPFDTTDIAKTGKAESTSANLSKAESHTTANGKQSAGCGHCDCKKYPILTAVCVLSSLAFIAGTWRIFLSLYRKSLQNNCIAGNGGENVEDESPGRTSQNDDNGIRIGQMTDQGEVAGASSFENEVERSPSDHQRPGLPLLPPRKILQGMPEFLSRKPLQQNRSQQEMGMVETGAEHDDFGRVEEESQVDGNVSTGTADNIYYLVDDVLGSHDDEDNNANSQHTSTVDVPLDELCVASSSADVYARPAKM